VAEWEYTGPHPVTDEAGTLVHPGDRRELAQEPDWGPWTCTRPDPEPDPPADPPPAPRPTVPLTPAAPAAETPKGA
jgi:hypothetical protein